MDGVRDLDHIDLDIALLVDSSPVYTWIFIYWLFEGTYMGNEFFFHSHEML